MMEYRPDFEELKPYFQAWWNGDALDRVALWVTAPRKGPVFLESADKWITPKVVFREAPERILDYFEDYCRGTFFGGLAVPVFWPNFGPDVFSAFLGTELNFSEDSNETSWINWSQNPLTDYKNLSCLEIKDSNAIYQKNLELTRLGIERGQGKFLVAPTDLHGGFDSLAVLRGGPDKAALDLVENPAGVKEAMKLLYRVWQKIYDDCYQIVNGNQDGTACSWTNLWAPGKSYPVQNDFSCLVSAGMYREFFLEELLSEIEYLDYSIYHLDGVEALQHLDLLLEIPKLNAIQWVSGAKFAKEGISRWFPLYQKIQAKKKSIVVYPTVEEIPLVLKNLKPEGLLIQVCCSSEDEARSVMAQLDWG
ncbi:MAG: hypothetical protein NTY10_05600 [Candidatus Omnitrophica bacterium]|nr:hypothetical protein [Candidatus Omnitrophota bacterium]